MHDMYVGACKIREYTRAAQQRSVVVMQYILQSVVLVKSSARLQLRQLIYISEYIPLSLSTRIVYVFIMCTYISMP